MKKVIYFLFAAVLFAACSDAQHEVEPLENSKAQKKAVTLAAGYQAQWMSMLPDETHLNMLTIPGTHDSGALYGTALAECQELTIREQLDAGIRFLDIRCKLEDGELKVYHGIFYQNLNLDDVLNDCIDFLTTNPDEAIIMSMRNENDGASYDEKVAFSARMDEYIAQNPDYWFLQTSMPSLADARGKIVLFRRYVYSDKGVNMSSGWADNATFTIGNIKVQDQYIVSSLSNISTKWNTVKSLLDEAQNGSPDMMYVNFCSGHNIPWVLPKTVARGNLFRSGVLDYLVSYLNDNPDPARLGCVLMDFPTETVINQLIETNFE